MKIRNLVMGLALVASAKTTLGMTVNARDNETLQRVTIQADTYTEFLKKTIAQGKFLVTGGRSVRTEADFNQNNHDSVSGQLASVGSNTQDELKQVLDNAGIPNDDRVEFMRSEQTQSGIPTDADIANAARRFCEGVPL